ncbi:MAG: hypothetical protein A2908_03645 [Candidatus Staskawiczbacteria bacterium RIFCSPLOWO2_01_FULL_38_12b]|uniref:POTRA domain-containing protein n=1 Tax=Candidatus Staskawiczbacteria bacterium RIFCSPLOWO2_01_FULL_38_12b TaxID=1802214 RepID=A0A1G2ICY9_9BACT|nr:MAG: hypothetical protein A2908_03645 [Candidatus Staskawiczbacteria bacterium RIFCSPLOWO2_01_FULL_38_12b]
MSYRKKHIHPKIKGLKKKKVFFKKPLFWVCFAMLLCMAAGGALIWLPQFQIKHIEISGNNNTNQEDIRAIARSLGNTTLFSLGKFQIVTKTIFLADTQKINTAILAAFPAIENAEVKKSLFETILITVKERTPYALVCPQERDFTNGCFLLDENGVIFQPQEPAQGNFITILATEHATWALGQGIIEKSTINAISKIQKNLKNNFQIDISQVNVSDPLIVTTSENWKIYFDPNSDIDLQITKMNTLLNNQITKSARKSIQYIYLQYKDRAYYK